MTHDDFYNFVYKNWQIYLFALAICAVFYTYVGRKYTHTWFDPLRIQLVASTFATTVFVFLFMTGIIKSNIFVYFCLAELIFWIAFMLPAKKSIQFSEKKLSNERSIAFILYLIFLVLFILFTIITYTRLGVPIFLHSRLDTYTGSGLGVLGRMIPFFKVYCIFYSFFLWEKSSKYSLDRLLVFFVFFIFIITGVLTGSRSSFFIFMYVYWGFCYIFHKNTTRITKYYKIFILGILLTLITFSIQSGSKNIVGSFQPFIERVIASGDAYFMALPKNNWTHINTGEWYKHLFYGLLGPTRIMSGFNYEPVGCQLTWIVYPANVGATYGPLSLPALLGFIYFGWSGLLFSFILGFLVSLSIFHIPSLLPKGIISSTVTVYLFIQFLSFINDPCLGMGYLFDTILNITFLIILITGIQFVYNFALKKPG